VQNAKDVIERNAKPRVVEKGPYSFTVVMRKNISFNEGDTRIFYNQTRQFFFNKTLSCLNCNLADKVIVPNILFQKLVDVVSGYSLIILEKLLNTFNESAFIEVSVGDLLFAGYKDPMITTICDHKFIRSICRASNIPERIGLFYNQNNTDDGLYEIDTGKSNVNNLARVYSWKNMTGNLSDKYWYGPSARMINGTDAELFQPNLFSALKLDIFLGQLCRSFELEFGGFSQSHDVTGFRYHMAESMNDVTTQKAVGFCNPQTPLYFNDSRIQEKGCAPAGLIDMGSCIEGNMRIYMSQPYFKNSPIELNEAIDGLSPPASVGISHFDIEPITGVIVEVQQLQQLNFGILRGNLKRYKNMRDLIMPVIWLNETAMIDDDTRAQILSVIKLFTGCFAVGLVLIVFASLLIIGSIGVFVCKCCTANQTQNSDSTLLVTSEHGPSVQDEHRDSPFDLS